MKTFKVHRTQDVSGVSGTGIVAEGVEFPSGKCVIEWYGQHASIDMNDSVADWLWVHGHGGSTTIEYDGETSTCAQDCMCKICTRNMVQSKLSWPRP
jgi:hypothetical protein